MHVTYLQPHSVPGLPASSLHDLDKINISTVQVATDGNHLPSLELFNGMSLFSMKANSFCLKKGCPKDLTPGLRFWAKYTAYGEREKSVSPFMNYFSETSVSEVISSFSAILLGYLSLIGPKSWSI